MNQNKNILDHKNVFGFVLLVNMIILLIVAVFIRLQEFHSASLIIDIIIIITLLIWIYMTYKLVRGLF